MRNEVLSVCNSIPYKKPAQCLEWACWLVSYSEGEGYPEKIELQEQVACAGTYADREKQFCAWLARKRQSLHLCVSCARSLGVW
jgi:hypothetical protein